MKTHTTLPQNAEKLRDWIKNRGGVAVWKNLEIGSSYAQSWSTPATVRLGDCNRSGKPITVKPICPHCRTEIRQENKPEGVDFLTHCTACSKDIAPDDVLLPYPAPNWRCGDESPEVFTEESQIVVEIPDIFKTINVPASRGGFGRKLVEACNECKIAKHVTEAWFEISEDEKTAKILYVKTSIPLNEYVDPK